MSESYPHSYLHHIIVLMCMSPRAQLAPGLRSSPDLSFSNEGDVQLRAHQRPTSTQKVSARRALRLGVAPLHAVHTMLRGSPPGRPKACCGYEMDARRATTLMHTATTWLHQFVECPVCTVQKSFAIVLKTISHFLCTFTPDEFRMLTSGSRKVRIAS